MATDWEHSSGGILLPPTEKAPDRPSPPVVRAEAKRIVDKGTFSRWELARLIDAALERAEVKARAHETSQRTTLDCAT